MFGRRTWLSVHVTVAMTWRNLSILSTVHSKPSIGRHRDRYLETPDGLCDRTLVWHKSRWLAQLNLPKSDTQRLLLALFWFYKDFVSVPLYAFCGLVLLLARTRLPAVLRLDQTLSTPTTQTNHFSPGYFEGTAIDITHCN